MGQAIFLTAQIFHLCTTMCTVVKYDFGSTVYVVMQISLWSVSIQYNICFTWSFNQILSIFFKKIKKVM